MEVVPDPLASAILHSACTCIGTTVSGFFSLIADPHLALDLGATVVDSWAASKAAFRWCWMISLFSADSSALVFPRLCIVLMGRRILNQ